MEIKEFLINYEKSAEFILMKYEEKERHNDSKYFIPNSLNLSDKESIIDKYLDCKDPNLNYVRLVENSKDSKDLKLSPKTRLKSKKKSTELNNKILERGNLTKVGIEITFDKDQIKPRESYHEGHILKVAYSEKYLDEHNNNIELFHLFATLFGFIDNQGLVTLVNKESEMETMERILMKSKNEYSEGLVFQKKHALSKMQIHIFNDYLNRRGLSLEKVIESFINDYLNSSLEKGKFQFRFPTENSTYLEKIRALLPEFEFLLKQYQIYVNEGEIDFELLELDSNPLRFSEIKSLTNRKYVYIDSDLIRNLRYIFFSDQSGLYYTETYKDKYTDFYNLLINENVKLVDFAHYQIVMINQLINEDYLHIDATGCVRINKIIMIYLISLLYNNEVLVYWHFPESSRRVIDDMIIKKQLSFEQTLFTKQEINYYNFFLNKKEFTNGADLRNKYLHGTNTNSEDEHQNDYYVLMKIIILTLLKIEDDIVVNELAKSPI